MMTGLPGIDAAASSIKNTDTSVVAHELNGATDVGANASTNGHGEPSLLVKLSHIIAVETAKVDDYLRANNIPTPTFDADGHADFPRLLEDIQKSRQEIVRATNELKDLIVGPTESMRWLGWDVSGTLSTSTCQTNTITAQQLPVPESGQPAEDR